MHTYEIEIEGTVQGVGFRPFVYTLAKRYGLNGTVRNGPQGVLIQLNASSETLQCFLDDIYNEMPPLAHIEKSESRQVQPKEFDTFEILATEESGERTARIPPDMSICKACEVELFDPSNRRYGYPFITCTHCGIRYSIIYGLPYDRAQTSMKFFKMCKTCEKEYNDPLDRRYHAQPIGCWECGPKISLFKDGKKVLLEQTMIVEKAAELLAEGNIVAVKGVGGYHLMCDATNDEAVSRLRERKHRPAKPFAVMVKDIDAAGKLAKIGKSEKALLTSPERPIVLLDTKTLLLSSHVAPNLTRIGLFLPYTPLHRLLFDKFDRPLVATSANITDEPICTNLASLNRLSNVYDYVLDHDRRIVNGCDDSVVTVVAGQRLVLRRARGYTPASIKLPKSLSKKVLGTGANQKSTIAIGFEDQVLLSPHIGDLDSIGSVQYYQQNIETLQRIYDFTPDVIAHDEHPGYESTKYAFSQKSDKVVLSAVQHHYAHILGVMAEKRLQGKVLGIAFDGTGYGDDGKLWGGEFLLCDYGSFERVAHFNYFKLIGGEKAIREPRRVALSLLFDLYGEEAKRMDIPVIHAFSPSELDTYFIMWNKSLNCVESSSVGRLFDAVASLLGVCQVMSYEGESGMMLEELYDGSTEGSFPFVFRDGKIDVFPMIREMLNEQNVRMAVSKFFHTLVEIIETLYTTYSLPLVLSGGVFQNRVLTAMVLEKIPEAIISTSIPPNDGGIALGQVAHQLDNS